MWWERVMRMMGCGSPGAPGHSRVTATRTCIAAALSTWGRHHPRTMFLVRLTSPLLRAVPRAGERPRGGKADGQGAPRVRNVG